MADKSKPSNLLAVPVGRKTRSHSAEGGRQDKGKERDVTPKRSRSNPGIQQIGGQNPVKMCSKDFELLKVLGNGSFGVVCKVKSITNGKIYAVKRLLQVVDPKYLDSEVAIMAKCNHDHTVNFFGWYLSRDNKTINIIMEYCEGGDLFHRLLNQKGVLLAETTVLTWFQQIVSAIHYLHSMQIIHRDLKPVNILFSGPDHLKVADFGISKMVGDKGIANTVIGSRHYMAPEVAYQGKIFYSYQSDVWSLGCVLVNMATLKSCFGDFEDYTRGNYTPIPRTFKAVPRLVQVCVRASPEKRPTTKQLLATLEATLLKL